MVIGIIPKNRNLSKYFRERSFPKIFKRNFKDIDKIKIFLKYKVEW